MIHEGAYIMRVITTHIVNPANDKITITVIDEPGSGGAHHEYEVGYNSQEPVLIKFQKGPIVEAGVNGLTQEVLLAICIDRLQCFQKGPYACRENAIALTKLEEATMWLQKRTRDRMVRGVEGTHQK
jgi:hypothetical protein